MSDPVTEPVTLAVLPKSADLETHVRLVLLGERRVLEFVDFVPSLGEFGRGYWITITDDAVRSHLLAAVDRAAP